MTRETVEETIKKVIEDMQTKENFRIAIEHNKKVRIINTKVQGGWIHRTEPEDEIRDLEKILTKEQKLASLAISLLNRNIDINNERDLQLGEDTVRFLKTDHLGKCNDLDNSIEIYRNIVAPIQKDYNKRIFWLRSLDQVALGATALSNPYIRGLANAYGAGRTISGDWLEKQLKLDIPSQYYGQIMDFIEKKELNPMFRIGYSVKLDAMGVELKPEHVLIKTKFLSNVVEAAQNNDKNNRDLLPQEIIDAIKKPKGHFEAGKQQAEASWEISKEYQRAYDKTKEIHRYVDPNDVSHQNTFWDTLSFPKTGFIDIINPDNAIHFLAEAEKIYKRKRTIYDFAEKTASQAFFSTVMGPGLKGIATEALLEGINLTGGYSEWLRDWVIPPMDDLWKNFSDKYKNDPDVILKVANDPRLTLGRSTRLFFEYQAGKQTLDAEERSKAVPAAEKITKKVYKKNPEKIAEFMTGKLTKEEFSKFITQSVKEELKKVRLNLNSGAFENWAEGITARVEDIAAQSKEALDSIEKFQNQTIETDPRELKKERLEYIQGEINGAVKGFQLLGQVGRLMDSPVLVDIARLGQGVGNVISSVVSLQQIIINAAGPLAIAGGGFGIAIALLSLVFSGSGQAAPDPIITVVIPKLNEIVKKLSVVISNVNFIDYKNDIYQHETVRSFAKVGAYLSEIHSSTRQISVDLVNFRNELRNIQIDNLHSMYRSAIQAVQDAKLAPIVPQEFRTARNNLFQLVLDIPRHALLTSSKVSLYSEGKLNLHETMLELSRGFQKNFGILFQLSNDIQLAKKHEINFNLDHQALDPERKYIFSINVPAYYTATQLFIEYLTTVDWDTIKKAYNNDVNPIDQLRKKIDEMIDMGSKMAGNIDKMSQSYLLEFLFEKYEYSRGKFVENLVPDFNKYRNNLYRLDTIPMISELRQCSTKIDSIQPPKVAKIEAYCDLSGFRGFSPKVIRFEGERYKGFVELVQSKRLLYYGDSQRPELGKILYGFFNPRMSVFSCSGYGFVKETSKELDKIINEKKEEINYAFGNLTLAYDRAKGLSIYDFDSEFPSPYSLIFHPDKSNHPLHQLCLPSALWPKSYGHPMSYGYPVSYLHLMSLPYGNFRELHRPFIIAEYLHIGTMRHEYSTHEPFSIKTYFTINVNQEKLKNTVISTEVCGKFNLSWPCAPESNTLISHFQFNELAHFTFDENLRSGRFKSLEKPDLFGRVSHSDSSFLVADEYPSILSVWPFFGPEKQMISTDLIKIPSKLIDFWVKNTEENDLKFFYEQILRDNPERSLELRNSIKEMDAYSLLIRAYSSLSMIKGDNVKAFFDQEEFLWDKKKLSEVGIKEKLFPEALTSRMEKDWVKIKSYRDCFFEIMEDNKTIKPENSTKNKNMCSGFEKPLVGNLLLNATLLSLESFRAICDSISDDLNDETSTNKKEQMPKTDEFQKMVKTEKPKSQEKNEKHRVPKREPDSSHTGAEYECRDGEECAKVKGKNSFYDSPEQETDEPAAEKPKETKHRHKVEGEICTDDEEDERDADHPDESDTRRKAPNTCKKLLSIDLSDGHEDIVYEELDPIIDFPPGTENAPSIISSMSIEQETVNQVEPMPKIAVASAASSLRPVGVITPFVTGLQFLRQGYEHFFSKSDEFTQRNKRPYNATSCAFEPEFDVEKGGFIFTCYAYNDTKPVGYVKFFNAPEFCASEDKSQYNIVEMDGIFTQARINPEKAPLCSALPLTFYDRACDASKFGALQGGLRGMTEVVETNLLKFGHSPKKAWMVSNGIYYSSAFTINFVSYQFQQDYLTSGVLALKDIATLAAFSFAFNTVSKGLQWGARHLSESGWNIPSGFVSSVANVASFVTVCISNLSGPKNCTHKHDFRSCSKCRDCKERGINRKNVFVF